MPRNGETPAVKQGRSAADCVLPVRIEKIVGRALPIKEPQGDLAVVMHCP